MRVRQLLEAKPSAAKLRAQAQDLFRFVQLVQQGLSAQTGVKMPRGIQNLDDYGIYSSGIVFRVGQPLESAADFGHLDRILNAGIRQYPAVKPHFNWSPTQKRHINGDSLSFGWIKSDAMMRLLKAADDEGLRGDVRDVIKNLMKKHVIDESVQADHDTMLGGMIAILLGKGVRVDMAVSGNYGRILKVRDSNTVNYLSYVDAILGVTTDWDIPANADERFTLNKAVGSSYEVVEINPKVAVPRPFHEAAGVTDLRGNPKPMIYRGIEHVTAQGGRVTSKIPGAVGEWTIRPKRPSPGPKQSFDIQVKFSDGSSTWFEIVPEDDDALTMKKVKAGLWRVFTLPGQEFKL